MSRADERREAEGNARAALLRVMMDSPCRTWSAEELLDEPMPNHLSPASIAMMSSRGWIESTLEDLGDLVERDGDGWRIQRDPSRYGARGQYTR